MFVVCLCVSPKKRIFFLKKKYLQGNFFETTIVYGLNSKNLFDF
jgi:hypothetical protein